MDPVKVHLFPLVPPKPVAWGALNLGALAQDGGCGAAAKTSQRVWTLRKMGILLSKLNIHGVSEVRI